MRIENIKEELLIIRNTCDRLIKEIQNQTICKNCKHFKDGCCLKADIIQTRFGSGKVFKGIVSKNFYCSNWTEK